MFYKLFKISISFALAFATVLSLSCCVGGDDDIVLPDIVFVAYFHYPEKSKYLSGEFIGTSGYYIDKNGEIKYFEFEDETEPLFEKESITIEEYSDLRNIEELHKRISEIGIDTNIEPLSQEDFKKYYKELSKIEKDTKLKCEGSYITITCGSTCFYGVRINDNKEEYIQIYEGGDTFYLNDDKYAKSLFNHLTYFFPETAAKHLRTIDKARETTTSETTEEQTILETTTEATLEETALTIPDEETILSSLTDEEKEVWLSMPDIVTMRVLDRYDEKEKHEYDDFLYSEIVYIDKMGQVKKIITYDECNSSDDDIIVPWLNDQINQNEAAEITNVADIHALIEFYNTFKHIDSNAKSRQRYSGYRPDENIVWHHFFRIYGIRNDGESSFETMEISSGTAGYLYVRYNETEENDFSDTSGIDTLDLYLQLDPFLMDAGKTYGTLTDE